MNMISTKINAILLAAIVACMPVCAAENQTAVIILDQPATMHNSVVWYKKRSTQVAAALAATAVAIYALAVYTNKVAAPVVLLTIFSGARKNAQDAQDVHNNNSKNVPVVEYQKPLNNGDMPTEVIIIQPNPIGTQENEQINSIEESINQQDDVSHQADHNQVHSPVDVLQQRNIGSDAAELAHELKSAFVDFFRRNEPTQDLYN